MVNYTVVELKPFELTVLSVHRSQWLFHCFALEVYAS